MIIAVIEDDAFKCAKIIEVISEQLPAAEFRTARSYKSGLRAAIADDLDLIILDMTLPSFDISADEEGGPPLVYGGKELLRQMKRRGVATPVIVVTQFEQFETTGDAVTLEELNSEMRDEFSGSLVESIYYNPTQSRWRELLRSAVAQVVSKENL